MLVPSVLKGVDNEDDTNRTPSDDVMASVMLNAENEVWSDESLNM